MKDEKLGLALSGGAVLGAAHIGVLRAIDELEIKISYIAGTSIGGLVAALYAFGKDWKEIKEIAADLDWLDISKISLSNFGLLTNEKLGKTFKENVGDVDFDQAEIPLAVITVDISTGEKKIISEGNVIQAVTASSALPGIFIPVKINNDLFVDGGVVENVPISALDKLGAKTKIAVDLNAKRDYKKPENIIDLLLNSFDMMIMNAARLQTKDADVLITPDLSNYDYINTDQTDELIEIGYEESIKILKKKFTE